VELAEAERRAAERRSRRLAIQAISENLEGIHGRASWASGRLDVARALVKASESSYQRPSSASYRLELGTLVDLLAARREAEPRALQEVETKVQLLDASVTLGSCTARWGALDSPRHQPVG